MNLLNLPGWEIASVKETRHDYRVEATYTPQPTVCPHCPASLFPKLYRHGHWQQLIMDLSCHGKRVGISLKRTRWRCQDCGKTFLQPLPDVEDGSSMTRRLVSYIEEQSLRRTFVAIADEVGVDEKTVRNVFAAYAERLDKEAKFLTPAWMGIDEVYLVRKHRCIVTNLKERTVVALLADRNKRTVMAYLRKLEAKEQVRVVAMDMWTPYRDAVRAYLPDAAIIIDKFHVVKMATQCLDAVRKHLRDGLTAAARRKLMRSRFLLLRRPKDLDAMQKLQLDAWLGSIPALDSAYKLKEAFYAIYDSPTKAAAWSAFEEWERSMSTEMKTAYQPLLTAVYNWKEDILAYFDHRATNACTEALNGIAKAIQRQGRGYSFKAIRAKLLYDPRHQKRPKYGESPAASLGADIGSMLADSEDARLLEDAQRHRPDSTQTLKFGKHDE
jgi:transposase